MINPKCLRLLFMVLLASVLTACATSSAPPLPNSPINARITDPEARRQLQRGNPIAASDIYSSRAANAATAAEQQDFQLIAAEILMDRALADEAQAKLAAIGPDLETLELIHRRDILVAKNFIYERDADAALAALPNPADVESSLNRGRVFETRAQAYEILQDPDNELIARINLEGQLRDPGVISRSHEQIWQLLTTQPLSTLRSMTTNVRGDIYQGWIELALAHSAAGTDENKRRDSINAWRERFTAHPANSDFALALQNPGGTGGFEINVSDQPIEQIAVLLPISGQKTANVAAAVRDGIITAHQLASSKATAPVLRFYDVGDNAGYARTAFKTAVSDGADAVIGPLRKEAVAAIVSQRDIPVPTITLNTVETSGPISDVNNVIQFGLAPEDEAVAAASRAAGLSLKNAIIFQADDSRGDREARAFQDAMFLYGGDVVHIAVLPKDEYDYSAQIKEALAIDKSDTRFKTLSRTIGAKLFFEPSIRNDVDVIFLALTSEQARSVRTQLDFFYARSVTRLGTSRIAGADNDPKKNKDLNTIFYPDAPWVLRKALRDDPLRKQILENFDNAEGVYAKLYALGADSYRMITNLEALSQGERLDGYTGDLELRSNGKILRHLDWAHYVEGVSQNVENVDAPELPSIQAGSIN